MSANDGQGTNGNGGPKVIAVPAAPAGTVVRQEFGAQQIARSGETASAALAAQARAAVEARYVVALQRPRDMAKVRDILLSECERFTFADAAIYHKPVGDGIEGPSIRMAEAAARAMGNVYTDTFAIYDDDAKRIIRVSGTDLERNLTFTKDVTVEKTMERMKLKEGQIPLSVRTNSQGKKTFTVRAETDDDILNKENALASKAMRVCLLRLIPGDLIDEAMRIAYHTVDNKITEHPEDEAKKMCDLFRAVGVSIEQLKEYLGHPALDTRGEELIRMKRLANAIKDGEATWADAVDNKRTNGPAEAKGEPQAATAAKHGIDGLAEKSKQQRTGAAAAATPMSKTPPADPADAISPGPGKVGAQPGQQKIPTPAAKPAERPKTQHELEEEANRKAAEPSDDDDLMPHCGR